MTSAAPFQLWVEGRPKVKQRPRLGRRRKAYTPEATTLEEDRIARAWKDAGGPVFEGPVSVYVDLFPEGYLIQVQSIEGSSTLAGDTDNYVKLVLDALQKAAFADDKAVLEVWATKHPRGVVPDEFMSVSSPD